MGFGIYGGRTKTDSKADQISSLPLTENLPSHLHCAAIMSELTQDEKQSFADVELDSVLTEDKLDWLIKQLLQRGNYFELIKETLTRSRDRYTCQVSKLQAACEFQKFFTDKGVEKRKDKIKLNVFKAEIKRQKDQEAEKTEDTEQPAVSAEAESFLRMLQVHNQKIEKIRKGYNDYC